MLREISAERLRELIEFSPETGEMWWKARGDKSWDAKNAGKRAFVSPHRKGYLHGRLFGKNTTAHRVMWKLVHGSDAEIIDHINHDKKDNRIVNLRSGSYCDNAKNMPVSVCNKTGVVGVVFYKQTKRWRSFIKQNGKFEHIGYFHDFDAAVAARKAAEAVRGFHVNHGRAA